MYTKYLLFAALLGTAGSCAAVDAGLLDLVMPDAKVVSGIHVDHTKATPFGRYVLSRMQADDQGLQKFMDQTGFDPRRDLNEILVASTGTEGNSQTLIVGQGVFDAARMTSAAKQAGVALTRYHGVDILQHNEHDRSGGIALLDSGTALIGDLASVQAAIDRRHNGSAPPVALAEKVRKVSMNNDVWFLTIGPPSQFLNGKIADPNLNGAMKGDMLQSVEEASGGLRFGAANVNLTAEVVARSEKDASALADVIRFFAGMLQMNRPSGPATGKPISLLDNLQLSAEANIMKLSLAMPEDQLEKILESRPPRKAVSGRR